MIAGFTRHIADRTDAHLVLAGPAADSVADDPDGAAVLGLVREAWHRLPHAMKGRVHVASLPMTDIGENAAIVNALQRHAAVDGESGVLLSDPRDLAAFGSAVVDLLDDRERARRMGVAAHARIRDEFLGPRRLRRHFELIERVMSAREQARAMTVWAPISAAAL